MFYRITQAGILLILLTCFTGLRTTAQCTTATVNWDNLDFLERNSAAYSTYITAGMFTNMVQTQRFAIGTNRLTIGTNYLTAGINGENTTHTGETGSYGTGADVQFTGDGVITLTFDTAVSNVQFSLYDIDRSQKVAITAAEGATARTIDITLLGGSTTLTLANDLTTTPTVTANTTTVANNVNTASFNVDIAGPVTSVTITVSLTGTCASSCGGGGTETGIFWLSDISACVYRNFPTNYYMVSQPYTGQPAYIIAVHDLNTIYMVDPASGRAVSLFTDNSPRVREINNIAYDPYGKILYYSIDGLERCTPAGNPDSVRYIRKYDFNTETFTEIIANVNNAPFNVPTFSQGIETGGAAFYNGSLFTGIEGKNTASTSGREAMIWRFDFDASGNPVKACQVFATPGDNGAGTAFHDWGDISIKDGILYDFNSQGGAALGNYNVINMQTNVITNTYAGLSSANKPRQVGQQYNGQLIWVHDSVTTANGTNIIGATKQKIVATTSSVPWVAAAGDATEGFVPKADFGDAPATYDPVVKSPAMHERDTAIHLGTTWDWEWTQQNSSDATGDGSDEDGLAWVPFLPPGIGNYVVQVTLYNNTGNAAKLIAWLDYNGNGVFDAAEAITPITVNSMSNYQSFNLYWPNTTNSFINGQYTFLRIRLTTGALTNATPTGYAWDGEVEDYRVRIDNFPLSAKLIGFTARALNATLVTLNWTTTDEQGLSGYDIERSADGINWTTIGFTAATGNNTPGDNRYFFNDMQPLKGKSYYRLKIRDINNSSTYSETRTVNIREINADVQLLPNPARTNAHIIMTSETNSTLDITIVDMQGRKLRNQSASLVAGANTVDLHDLDGLPEGTYIVQLKTNNKIITKKLVIGQPLF